MNYQITVANIRSDGCANTICNSLGAIDGVNDAIVNIANGAVIVSASKDNRAVVSDALLHLGYPESTTSRLRNSIKVRAKSFISCVRGRLKYAA